MKNVRKAEIKRKIFLWKDFIRRRFLVFSLSHRWLGFSFAEWFYSKIIGSRPCPWFRFDGFSLICSAIDLHLSVAAQDEEGPQLTIVTSKLNQRRSHWKTRWGKIVLLFTRWKMICVGVDRTHDDSALQPLQLTQDLMAICVLSI